MLKFILKLLSFLVGRHLPTPEEWDQTTARLETEKSKVTALETLVMELRRQIQSAQAFTSEKHRDEISRLLKDQEQLKLQLQTSRTRSSQLALQNEQETLRQLNENQALLDQLNWLSGTIAHDFRAPLRAIDANTFFLQDDLGDAGPPDAVKSIGEIRRNGQRMGVLIDGLLDYLRAGITPLNLQKLNFKDILDQTLNEHFSLLQQPVKITGDMNLRLLGDRALLIRMLKELLDNAVKFSSTCDRPEVEVRRVGIETFEVRDNGAGFDKAHAGKLFQLFHRLHGYDEFPGEGIGLCVAQRILSRHQGVLSLTRQDNTTIARFNLPDPSTLAQPQATRESSSSNEGN